MDYKTLATRLKTPETANELKIALTHSSFYKTDNNGNSRYIFLGMYAFKGEVAEILFRYLPATGTQLQHALGNLFKNEHLERLFFAFELKNYIRHGIEFEVDKRRHIFVYGLLGYLFAHCGKENLREFIVKHFILPFQHVILPKTHNRDTETQCNLLSEILYNCRMRIAIEKEDELFCATVTAGNRLLAQERSKSYRYVRRKTLKKALITLAGSAEEYEQQQPGYEARRQQVENRLQQKSEAEKAQKQQAYKEKQEKKAAERKTRKLQQQQTAIAADIKRRRAKAAAKLRKEEQARKTAAENAKKMNMSANKRRHLQDQSSFIQKYNYHIFRIL